MKLGTHLKSLPKALDTNWLVTKLKKCTNIFKWNYWVWEADELSMLHWVYYFYRASIRSSTLLAPFLTRRLISGFGLCRWPTRSCPKCSGTWSWESDWGSADGKSFLRLWSGRALLMCDPRHQLSWHWPFCWRIKNKLAISDYAFQLKLLKS